MQSDRFAQGTRQPSRISFAALLVSLSLFAGCASRPVNSPLTHFAPGEGYQYQTRVGQMKDPATLVILAFSGGGTRAAAFSYGVLEMLRRTEAVGSKGNRFRLIDAVDIITGVSGGSFTALAYGLYGERLFDEYEKRFLKHNVQGELISGYLNPTNWAALSSAGWGRSELAAKLYDEILFEGATFADLQRRPGPLIAVTATDLSTGTRVLFNQNFFNVICSDLGPVSLSRAAAASSAVPVVLSPITINNYGGTCGYAMPAWARLFTDPATAPRPAARTVRRLIEIQTYDDSAHRPYLHLVDGGVSDNLGLRVVLDFIEGFEASHMFGGQDQVPEDSGQNVVEVVCDSPGQMPDRFHLLRLPDLLLQASALDFGRHAHGDIPRDGDRVGGATVAHGNRPNLDEESLAVPAAGRHIELTRLACERPPDERVQCVDVLAG